jgi:hypothetical protein
MKTNGAGWDRSVLVPPQERRRPMFRFTSLFQEQDRKRIAHLMFILSTFSRIRYIRWIAIKPGERLIVLND